MSEVQTAAFFLLAIWTSWLIIALAMLNESYGRVLVALFALTGLPLALTGTVSWRLYLMIWLAIHVVASAVVTVVERKPEQVLAGSVSLGGVVWLLVLHPASAARYFTGILLMILTVAGLVLFEYGWWWAFTGMIRWRVEDAVAQANHDADRRLEAVKHEFETELAEVQQKLQQIQANQPLEIHPIPGRGPRPQDATKETDQAQVVLTMLELDPTPLKLEPTPGIDRRTGLSPASRGPSEPVQATRMIVSRKVVTLSPEPGETAGHLIARAENRLREELAATAAAPLAEKIGECLLPAAQPRAATVVEDGRKVLHNIVIGKPVEEIPRGLGAPLPMSEALGRIAAVAPIAPVDIAFTAVKRVIQIGSIAWGALTMNPALVAAGVKAIGHDKLVDTLERGIERTLVGRGPAKVPDGRGDRQPSGRVSGVGRPVRADPASRSWRTVGTEDGLRPSEAERLSREHPGTPRPAAYPPLSPRRRNNPGEGPTRGGRAPR